MGIVSADFGGRRIRRRIVRWVVFIFLGLALFWWAPRLLLLYTEWLWFKFDVGFPGVFWTVLNTKIGLGLVFGLAFLILVLGNVELARRLARRTVWYDEERALRQRIAEVMEYFAARYLYLALAVFAVLVAYGVGRGAADQWNKFLLFHHGVSFGTNDPIFGRDVGFYVFRLPFWQFLWQWAYVVLWAVFVLSAGAHYLDKAIRVLRGVPAFAPHVKVHLSVLLGAILVVKGIGYRIDAFNLLYSPRGVTFGASYADIHAQLLAVQGTPTTALVRVPSIERLRVGRALDLGADGLVLPRCDAPADAADALRWMRFPPAGIRGVALLNRGNGYFERTHDNLAATVNDRVVGVFQVESPEAVAAAGDLAAIEGVDVLFVGPADLSHSMGVPGRFAEPAFTDALDAVVAACRAHGKSAGILLADASFVPAYRERGFSFLGVGSDAGWVSSGARAQAAAARAALG